MEVSVGSAELKEQLEFRGALAATLRAVEAGDQPAVPLSDLAERLSGFGDGAQPGSRLWAFAAALTSLGMAAAWELGTETADANALAHRDAARLIAQRALALERQEAWNVDVVATLHILANLEEFIDVRRAAVALQRVPLTAPVTNLLLPTRSPERPEPQPEPAAEPTVLLHFRLDRQPMSWPVALQAGRLYRISASAVVDNWPGDADRFEIEWDSPVPQTVLERQGFVVTKTGDIEADELSGRSGRDPTRRECRIDAGSHVSRLRWPSKRCSRRRAALPSNKHIRTVGCSVRDSRWWLSESSSSSTSWTPESLLYRARDRLNLLHLLDATARFAAFANERKELRGIREPEFQARLKEAFAMDPRIGGRIHEAPKLGGGTTDLILERIVNELKVSRSPIDPDGARKFVRQPTQYASAGDCPVSVLTILDDSPKADPPGVQSNYMGWAYPALHGLKVAAVPSMVAVVIIPIGFPVPSAWSRVAS